MKYKLTIAIIVTVLLIGGGIFETIFVEETFSTFGSMVSELAKSEEYDLEEVKSVGKYWEEKADLLEITIPHVQLTEITVTYGELVGAVRNEDYDSASALLLRIQQYVVRIGSLYGFSARNII
ncbi:MAG: DUF4363 family protein [Clostridia bacterium]|nr:DUF4363 family protein [Clostridia bacterium]